jgi:FMN-dependent NADH-azoreductase
VGRLASAFGPAAAASKMAVFAGESPRGEGAAAWQATRQTFGRFDSAEHLLVSVPMWNAGMPYVLKQLIDVISQPGLVGDVDPCNGYSHVREVTNKKPAVIYTNAAWGPGLGSSFGTNFQSSDFGVWLPWTDHRHPTDSLPPDARRGPPSMSVATPMPRPPTGGSTY